MDTSQKKKIAIAIIGTIFIFCLIAGGVFKFWPAGHGDLKEQNGNSNDRTHDAPSDQSTTKTYDVSSDHVTNDNIKPNPTSEQPMTEAQTTQTYCNFTSVKYNRQQCHDHLSNVFKTKETSITDLKQNLFTEIQEDDKLNLSSTKLKELNYNTFKDKKNISLIDMSSNELTLLQNNSFNIYNQTLKTLILASNKLARLESDTFHGLSNLKYLDISNNHLEFLPDKIFDELYNLRVLRLGSNKLTQLNSNIFMNLWFLEVLDISHNSVTSLPIDIFKGTVMLKKLDVSDMKSYYELKYDAFVHVCKNHLELTTDFQISTFCGCTIISQNGHSISKSC